MSQIELQTLQNQLQDWNVIYFERCESTNTEAIRLAGTTSLTTPAMVLTECQTAGRGRLKREWSSSSGSLTVSLVFRQSEVRLPHRLLSLETGVSAAEVVERITQTRVQIKWPNDLVLAGKKLGGILVESVSNDFFVIGIGLNVNNPISEEQGATLPAISLADHFGQTVSMTQILADLANHLGTLLRTSSSPTTIERIQQRCFLTTKTVKIDVPGSGEVLGVCEGINVQGSLVIRDDSQKRIALSTGHILEILEGSH